MAPKQFITYNIDLENLNDHQIGYFRINLFLLVPHSAISTDIRTGFPGLMEQHRKHLDYFFVNQYRIYSDLQETQKLRPLAKLDGFLARIEPRLTLFFKNHYEMDLESMSVEIYTEIVAENQPNQPSR